ncbi:MAG: hypothetical protein ACYC7I_01495 [Gammaproteobacteria bacterium]
MMRFRKTQLETLAAALGDRWKGQAQDWTVVVEAPPDNAGAHAVLYVEIGFDDGTPITTVSVGIPDAGNDHAWAAHKARSIAMAEATARGHTQVVAAVRRSTLATLRAQGSRDDIEPLLGYLRCCGVLVIE